MKKKPIARENYLKQEKSFARNADGKLFRLLICSFDKNSRHQRGLNRSPMEPLSGVARSSDTWFSFPSTPCWKGERCCLFKSIRLHRSLGLRDRSSIARRENFLYCEECHSKDAGEKHYGLDSLSRFSRQRKIEPMGSARLRPTQKRKAA